MLIRKNPQTYSSLAEQFNIINDYILKSGLTSITWREFFLKLREKGVEVDWKEIESCLSTYEAYRYGGQKNDTEANNAITELIKSLEVFPIEINDGRKLREELINEISKVVLGRNQEAELLLVSLLAQGHAILEGAPGVSKTLLAKSFAKCLGLEFRRGPVFTNLLLADEINRAPPKVQSALLESMQERQVTVEGYTEKLPEPFMVLATQNPLEYQGVYPLPEGQLDRFMVRVTLSYPDPATESRIIQRNLQQLDLSSVRQVADGETIKVFEE